MPTQNELSQQAAVTSAAKTLNAFLPVFLEAMSELVTALEKHNQLTEQTNEQLDFIGGNLARLA